MTNFEDQNLPPELGDVAKQLRDNRHEATPLELDRAKQRILTRASAPAGTRRRWLQKPTFVVAAVVAVAVGGGSAAAFGVHFKSHTARVAAVHHHAKAVAPASKVTPSVIPSVIPSATPSVTPTAAPVFPIFNLGALLNGLLGSILGGGGGVHHGHGIAQQVQYFINALEQLIFNFIGHLLGG